MSYTNSTNQFNLNGDLEQQKQQYYSQNFTSDQFWTGQSNQIPNESRHSQVTNMPNNLTGQWPQYSSKKSSISDSAQIPFQPQASRHGFNIPHDSYPSLGRPTFPSKPLSQINSFNGQTFQSTLNNQQQNIGHSIQNLQGQSQLSRPINNYSLGMSNLNNQTNHSYTNPPQERQEIFQQNINQFNNSGYYSNSNTLHNTANLSNDNSMNLYLQNSYVSGSQPNMLHNSIQNSIRQKRILDPITENYEASNEQYSNTNRYINYYGSSSLPSINAAHPMINQSRIGYSSQHKHPPDYFSAHQKSFQHGFIDNNARMIPPPSPNVLSYMPPDHNALYQLRNFQPHFHMNNLWNDPSLTNLGPINGAPYQTVHNGVYTGLDNGSVFQQPPINSSWQDPNSINQLLIGNNDIYNGYISNDYSTQQPFNHIDPAQLHALTSNTSSMAIASTMGTRPIFPPLHAIPLVPGTSYNVQEAKNPSIRDAILKHAHTQYNSRNPEAQLRNMLLTLHNIHPTHLPTLLLLACVFFVEHDYQSSIKYNKEILKLNANYVEAMSNLGTTYKTINNFKEAEKWWWKALRLKPDYWDAADNLIGLMNSQEYSSENMKDPSSINHIPSRSSQENVVAICHFIEKEIVQNQSFSDFAYNCMSYTHFETSKFQNLLYYGANAKYSLGDIEGARRDYEKALELALGGQTIFHAVASILRCFHNIQDHDIVSNLSNFQTSHIPMLLLTPEQSLQTSSILFPKSQGILPSFVRLLKNEDKYASSGSQSQLNRANHITSAILLTLAKIYQDQTSSITALPLLLPLYYLSLALFPSPSTCNNLGILLATIPAPATTEANKSNPPITGPGLALQYYHYGLSLDANHPHLYTNLGSLLKDMGHIRKAISMYEKAVQVNPKFDVALANLGNALKDSGQIQDSIQWYKRAVEVNPDFVEAICGLVNALCGVCDWRGRNSQNVANQIQHGWMEKIVEIVNKQLSEGSVWGNHFIFKKCSDSTSIAWIRSITNSFSSDMDYGGQIWKTRAQFWEQLIDVGVNNKILLNEGSWIVRATEKAMRRLIRLWYWDRLSQMKSDVNFNWSNITQKDMVTYARPSIVGLPMPPIPTVLPFHTFTYPLSARQVRLICHRNALRISYNTLVSPWLPSTVYPPPPPPRPHIKLGYVSSDFNNHPLSHLMQSVFGMHDTDNFTVYCYATTPSDQSQYREKIKREVTNFIDVSGWTTQAIVERIIQDGIHILINLNGYTKGARNEVFAARPAPLLMSYMGFASTLGGNWCDYFIADPIVCPPETVCSEQWINRSPSRYAAKSFNQPEFMDQISEVDTMDLDPEEQSEDWVYTEKILYMPYSYFINDHRQGFREPDELRPTSSTTDPQLQNQRFILEGKEELELGWLVEQNRRTTMRRELFPNIPDDYVIFANFNQLYKIDPNIFKVWLNVLKRVPNSILWLLQFPAAGEEHIRREATELAGPDVASRIIFTEVAAKHIHIHRGRVADIFFDTPECNAHTTAVDILWSGTPIVTFARHPHKMCSRVAASIAWASGYGEHMVVDSYQHYEEQSVDLANSLKYQYVSGTYEEIFTGKGFNIPPRFINHPILKQSCTFRCGNGKLNELRKALFLTRDISPLFDTPRWVRDLERGYKEAWDRWTAATDDQPQAIGNDPNPKLSSVNANTYPSFLLKPRFIDHMLQYLSKKKSEGHLGQVKSGCIWISGQNTRLSSLSNTISPTVSQNMLHNVQVNKSTQKTNPTIGNEDYGSISR